MTTLERARAFYFAYDGIRDRPYTEQRCNVPQIMADFADQAWRTDTPESDGEYLVTSIKKDGTGFVYITYWFAPRWSSDYEVVAYQPLPDAYCPK